MRHGLSTAEAALGRVGRVGVGEHDEGVADRQRTARFPPSRGIAKKARIYLQEKLRSLLRAAAAILYMCDVEYIE